MKVKKMLLREETEKVLHTKSNGDKLVAAASGDGYTAFTKDDVHIGHISAETDAAAIAEFSKKEPKYEALDMSLEELQRTADRYLDVEIDELMRTILEKTSSMNREQLSRLVRWCRNFYALLEEFASDAMTEGYMDAHEGVAHVDTLDMMAALKAVVREYGHMELATPVYCELMDDDHGRRLALNSTLDEGLVPDKIVPDKIGGDINLNLDGSHSSVGFLGGTATNTNNGAEGNHDASNTHKEDLDDDFMDAENMEMNEFDSHTGKLEDIEFVMTEYIADSLLIEFVKKVDATTWLVGVEDEVVTVKFDPSWSEYVYTIEGKGPYSHRSYEYISRDVYDFVMANRTDNSADLEEDYGNDEMTEFLNWIQDYKGGCLWDAFTTEFNTDEDPDIDNVLNWLEDFNNDAYYAYIEKDEHDDDYEDLSAFESLNEVRTANKLFGVNERADIDAIRDTLKKEISKRGLKLNTEKVDIDSAAEYIASAGDEYSVDQWIKDTKQNYPDHFLDEAFDMTYGPDLSKLSWQVASYLDVDALGEENWIEFICDDPRDVAGNRGVKTMRFEAIGENDHKYGFIRTAGSRCEVKFRNGSEAMCNSAEEVARFIAGEFGISI